MYKRGIPLVVVDIETGGLEVERPIIQLAAVVIDTETWEEKESFECKLRFDKNRADSHALILNHWSEENWADAIPDSQGLDQLAKLFEKYAGETRKAASGRRYNVAIAGGYNSQFDSERILFHSRRFGIFQPVDPRFLCVMQLAFWKQLVLPSYKLTELATYFGILTEGAHDALTDVRITIEVMKQLLRDPQCPSPR